jgi:large subunit ribosomal protein L5e
MGFVKILKTKAYFKRFQTKYRRRREGKTDYYARKRLVIQDKDKYNSPKYRFVARATSTKIITQVIYATLTGDKVLAAAESTELRRFGLEAGLTNYAAAYATGLLLARRLLKKTGLDKVYEGNKTVDGKDYDVSTLKASRRPFKAVLDVGLIRTTTGNKVFGALKGACDGGLYIPHSTKRFPGFKKEGENETYDIKVHKDRIFGIHVDNYMKELKEESQEDYQKQFSKWDAAIKKAGAKSVEDLFKKIHAEIKKNPDRVKKGVKANPKRDHAKKQPKRLNAKQRKENVAKRFKIAEAAQKKGKKK